MKIKKRTFLPTFPIQQLPTFAIAPVNISYTYYVTFFNAATKIYLVEGPNYGSESKKGLISIFNFTSNGTMLQTFTLMNLAVPYSVHLSNVPERYNVDGRDTNKAPVYMNINAPEFKHVAGGYATGLVSWFTSATNDAPINSPLQITLSAPVIHLLSLLWSDGPSSITDAVEIIIQYKVDLNF